MALTRLRFQILPDSIYCRLYVLTVVIQTIIDLAIEGELLVRFHQAGVGVDGDTATASRKMNVYLGIFVLAQYVTLLSPILRAITRPFAAYFSWLWPWMLSTTGTPCKSSVSRERLLIVLAVSPHKDTPSRAFNLSFMVYSIIQIGEIREIGGALSEQTGISDIPINVLTTIIPCVIAAAELAYIGLGWKIYTEFGWQVYKFLGANRQIKKMYAQFQVFECLVKFDVFFWVAFCVQLIWLVLQRQDWEYYLTVAALPLSIIVLVEGNLAARHENKWMMYTFISGCFGALVYFVYKVGTP